MSRHAIIDKDGNVVSVIIWEGAEWLPPRNHTVVQSDTCAIGDIYDFEANTFSKPTSPDEQPVNEDVPPVSDEK